MVNFVLKDRDLDRVPEFLKDKVPEFFESEEFRLLTPNLAHMPGIICGAFREYLVKLHQMINRGTRSKDVQRALKKCYSAIELMSSSNDPEVQNLVIVEIFEHLSWTPTIEKQIKARLGTKSRVLYETWIERKGRGNGVR